MSALRLVPSANWYGSSSVASDGDMLLVTCARSSLVVASARLDRRPPALLFHGVVNEAHHERTTAAVVWRSDDGLVRLVSCGDDGLVRLWLCRLGDGPADFQAHCQRQHDAHGKLKVTALHHAARSPHVAVSADERGSFVVWDTVAHTTRTLFLGKISATEVRCSPHTEHVVAVAGRRGQLWIVSLAAGGRLLQKLRGHDDDVTSVSWCPELTSLLSVEQDHLLVTASRDKTLRVWGSRAGRCHVTQRVTAVADCGYRRSSDQAGKAWLGVLWTSADCVYSSGLAGQLLRWRLTEHADNCQVIHRLHGRGLFNIVALAGGALVTSGIDRQLVLHEPRSQATGAVPTLGGYVTALDTSAVDPGRLAIGCGDSTIRVWNLNSESDYAMTTLWQGIKAKVLTVAWHPHKDNRLAFGTEEGRVGVCDPTCGRAPLVCADHHGGPVYGLAWTAAGALLSLSLGAVWRHEPAQLAATVWAAAAGRAAASQISVGGGGVALGRQDGSVELVDGAGAARAAALGHRRLVTVLRWGPAADAATELAVASYDTHVSVFRVPDLGGSACPKLLQARVMLTGHKSRVLDLAWSPHVTGRLVSASQDTSVRVWDTDTGSLVAVYGGHRRPVRCCLPHPLLPGAVFSGGEDNELHLWQVDQQGTSLPEKRDKATKSNGVVAATSGAGKKEKRNTAGGMTVRVLDDVAIDGDQSNGLIVSNPRELCDGRKGRTQRSLFPLTNLAENRGKAHSQADLDYLMAGGDGGAADADQKKHLGLFGDDKAFRALIDTEVAHHESHRSLSQLTQMSVWCGDLAALLERAGAEATLTDDLLALAPTVSYRFWQKMSLEYAEQLENSKDVTKASSVLLACHKVKEAISLLVRHGLYREALCVSRLRLPPDDPGHGDIVRQWAEQLTADGNMEQAAKCYLRLGDPAAAAGVLSRRSDPDSLRLASRLWTSAGDLTQARALSLLCLHTSCLRSEWAAGLRAARETSILRAAGHLCVAHRELATAVEEVRPHLYTWAVRLLRQLQSRLSADEIRGEGPSGEVPSAHAAEGVPEEKVSGGIPSAGSAEDVPGEEVPGGNLTADSAEVPADEIPAEIPAEVSAKEIPADIFAESISEVEVPVEKVTGKAVPEGEVPGEEVLGEAVTEEKTPGEVLAEVPPAGGSEEQVPVLGILENEVSPAKATKVPGSSKILAVDVIKDSVSSTKNTRDQVCEVEVTTSVSEHKLSSSRLSKTERETAEILGEKVTAEEVPTTKVPGDRTAAGEACESGVLGSELPDDEFPGAGQSSADVKCAGSADTTPRADATPRAGTAGRLEAPAHRDAESRAPSSDGHGAAAPAGREVTSAVPAAGAVSLLTRVRQAWRAADLSTPDELESSLQEVRYLTKPSTARQLWLYLSAELCAAALAEGDAADERLLEMLAVCRESVPSKLPPLCCLLVPTVRVGACQIGDDIVLSAILVVLHQTLLTTGAASANDTRGPTSANDAAQLQCTSESGGGSSEEVAILAPAAELKESVSLWRSLWAGKKSEEEEHMLSEIMERLDVAS